MPQIKFNSIAAGGHILHEDAREIHVPVIIMREGIIHGSAGYEGAAMRKYESFADGINALEGTHILRGHSQVSPDGQIIKRADQIGHIKNVSANASKRDARAVAAFDKSKLTPRELAEIRSPEAFDASIEFSCNTVRKNGVYGGRSYEWEELGPFRYYGVAKLLAGSGACSVNDGCGFKMNKKFSRSNNMSEIKVNSRARKTPDGEVEIEVSLDDEMSSGLRQFEDAYQEDARIRLNQAKETLAATQKWISKNPIDRTPQASVNATVASGMSPAESRARRLAQEIRLSQTTRQNAATPSTIVYDSYPSLDDPNSQLAAARRITILLEQSGFPLTPEQKAILEKYPDLGEAVEAAKKKAQKTLSGRQ